MCLLGLYEKIHMDVTKKGTTTDGPALEVNESLTEDPHWERCTCEKDTCASCRAERVAIIPDYNTAVLVVDTGREYLNQVRPVESQKEGTPDEELASNISAKSFGGSLNRYIPMVTLEVPAGSVGKNVFIHWFHALISDSTLHGRTDFSYASPMIVYLFACNFQQRPSQLQQKVLPETVQMQVIAAIAKGNERYDTLYPGEKKELTPEETLQAWPEVQMKVLCSYSSDMALYQSLYELILALKEDQVLLIFRKKPYKVISVVCTADPEAVCMFDSQMHRVHIGLNNGALMFYCKKQYDLVTMMLHRFEHYCFRFEGQCHFLLLQRDALKTQVSGAGTISDNRA